ncbi:aspartate/glutamate racemase family protein [Thalassococcus sp. S3]|uniref:aspartate/glutamate racemase family protein n=1 Tax=Thalassococcus sp. S3 TaxID=2017482 RepID=UPI001024671A|nr:aspartate/glutamate racemase family protein [Thalassococcus sp. S3]QBF31081.1 hypothetical protein CFI11_07590 [Thalassococcus sp. S3]
MRVPGGKSVYGASVGILMLDAQFPRIPGDIGNAQTWDFPVLYRIVHDASPERVVGQKAEGLLPAFIAAAQEMVSEGADGITTTCGFLSIFQTEIAKAVNVPVATSSLMQVPLVNRLLPPGKRCAVLTISASALTPEHLIAADVPLETPVGTTEGGMTFTRSILGDAYHMDVEAARADNVAAAEALLQTHPETGAIVLECTNMAPYAADISRATGVPVFSMVSFVEWFQSGLMPKAYPLHG